MACPYVSRYYRVLASKADRLLAEKKPFPTELMVKIQAGAVLDLASPAHFASNEPIRWSRKTTAANLATKDIPPAIFQYQRGTMQTPAYSTSLATRGHAFENPPRSTGIDDETLRENFGIGKQYRWSLKTSYSSEYTYEGRRHLL